MEANKEDILKAKWNPRYAIPMPFGYEAIYEAMEEYANARTQQLQQEYDKLKGELTQAHDAVHDYDTQLTLVISQKKALQAECDSLKIELSEEKKAFAKIINWF